MTTRSTDAMQRILDPTGESELGPNTSLAPRLSTLAGTTAGLLDNGKPNGEVLLQEVGEYLKSEYGVAEVIPYRKGYFGTPVEQTQVEKILATCNFAVAAIGD